LSCRLRFCNASKILSNATKRFSADEKLTAFLELERVTHESLTARHAIWRNDWPLTQPCFRTLPCPSASSWLVCGEPGAPQSCSSWRCCVALFRSALFRSACVLRSRQRVHLDLASALWRRLPARRTTSASESFHLHRGGRRVSWSSSFRVRQTKSLSRIRWHGPGLCCEQLSKAVDRHSSLPRTERPLSSGSDLRHPSLEVLE